MLLCWPPSIFAKTPPPPGSIFFRRGGKKELTTTTGPPLPSGGTPSHTRLPVVRVGCTGYRVQSGCAKGLATNVQQDVQCSRGTEQERRRFCFSPTPATEQKGDQISHRQAIVSFCSRQHRQGLKHRGLRRCSAIAMSCAAACTRLKGGRNFGCKRHQKPSWCKQSRGLLW
jgi:hypothetical protein